MGELGSLPEYIWAFLGGVIGAIATYYGTKRTTKVDLDSIYTEEIKTIINERKADLEAMKKDYDSIQRQLDTVNKEMRDLKEEMNAKNRLIEKLEEDNEKLEKDKQAYKSLLREAQEEVNQLKGGRK